VSRTIVKALQTNYLHHLGMTPARINVISLEQSHYTYS
jgi:hypothetical protein